ncbi:hypothetical protein BDF14DRAFT_935967 [Spinellus fusiger]|nr:hypothetical protein BDF14DRAFT_935967 [Spinellus fusiger]
MHGSFTPSTPQDRHSCPSASEASSTVAAVIDINTPVSDQMQQESMQKTEESLLSTLPTTPITPTTPATPPSSLSTPLLSSTSATLTTAAVLATAPYQHLIKRSESTSSVRSSTNTTVEDSSLTKSAYKLKKTHTSMLPPQSVVLQEKINTGPELTPSTSSSTVNPLVTVGVPEERSLIDTFLTLHLSRQDPSFYQSETIPNTINPTFRALDVSQWMDWYDGVQTAVVVRVWARHSVPDSAALATQAHPSPQGFHLLIEWEVELDALVFVGKTLQCIGGVYPENTLLFELDDGFYTATDSASKLHQRANTAESIVEADSSSLDNESLHKGKRSYTYNAIVRLNTVKDCIFDTMKSTEEVRQHIQTLLETNQHGFRLVRECNQRQQKVEETKTHLQLQIQANKTGN